MTAARARMTAVVGVIVLALGGGGWVIGKGFHVGESAASARLFDQVLDNIANKYVDSVDVGALYERAAAGLVKELGDPHSVYLDSARLARVQASINGLVGNVGLEVDTRSGWVKVVAALPGTPAEQAGLRAGDRLLAIDGRSTEGWTPERAIRALRGLPGSSVRIAVERLGTTKRTELMLERDTVYVRPVQRSMVLEDGVGYVSLRTFSDSAAIELAATIDSLRRAGMRSLILDLRDNPGGLLAQGAEVADLFLDKGKTIVSLHSRGPDARRDVVDQRSQRWPEVHVAVLVNRATASAAEIVAGALQDHDRALVLGRPTYGKGSAQSVFSFHDAAGVKLTTARWFTPAGRNIEYLPPGARDTAPGAPRDSSGRPVFKTDSGRKVFGGGGIVPDVLSGDSVSFPTAARVLFTAVGPNVRKLRAAVTVEARRLAKRGVSGPMFDVTADMRGDVYQELVRSGVTVDRPLFDNAADWLDRALGGETVRYAYGRQAETRRLVLSDRVVQEAATKLKSARTTRELLGSTFEP